MSELLLSNLIVEIASGYIKIRFKTINYANSRPSAANLNVSGLERTRANFRVESYAAMLVGGSQVLSIILSQSVSSVGHEPGYSMRCLLQTKIEYEAVHNFDKQEKGDLSVREGDIVTLLSVRLVFQLRILV